MTANPRPHPAAVESERALLGGLIEDARALDDLDLEPTDFYRPEHRRLFALLRRMVDAGDAVDAITVSAAVKATGQAEEHFGGVAYVAQLPMECPSTYALPTYAREVRTTAVQREALDLMERRIGDLYTSGPGRAVDASEVIADLVSALQSIGGRAADEHWRTLAEHLDETVDDLQRRSVSGELPGQPTGFDRIDEVMVCLRAGLHVLAARPGMGKSALALDLAERIAANPAPGVVGIFSLEMTGGDLAERMAGKAALVPSDRLARAELTHDEWAALLDKVERLRDLPVYIDDRHGLRGQDIEKGARILHRKHGLKVLFVDFLQLVEADERGEYSAERLKKLAYRLANLGKALGCPVVALAQLNRKLEDRADKRPQKGDLEGSGGISQAATSILFLYRASEYNADVPEPRRTELIINKHRKGRTGTVFLDWDGPTMTFNDYEEVEL